jgi:biotin-(acetyl-CoA carboxylase) ligase
MSANTLCHIFDLYKKLLQKNDVALSEQESYQCELLGLQIQQNASGFYYLKNTHCYHPPYEDHNFPAHLQKIIHIESIIPTTLDITIKKRPTLILAEAQTHGRGQYNRQWYSPLGRQILLTYYSPRPIRTWDALWALWRVLENQKVWFKWPNDLYHQSGKVAGFLGQHSPEGSQMSFGLNLTLNPQWPLGSLLLMPKDVQRESLIKSWLYWLECAQDLHQSQIAQDLSGISMIELDEEVLWQSQRYRFKGINEDGSVTLYNDDNSLSIKPTTGSLTPCDPSGWVFQQKYQR